MPPVSCKLVPPVELCELGASVNRVPTANTLRCEELDRIPRRMMDRDFKQHVRACTPFRMVAIFFEVANQHY